MTTVYDTINTLPDTSFIGGTDKTFTFTCYAENGTTNLNITSATIAWLLCPYGQFSSKTLEKGVGTGITILSDSPYSHQFTVTLDAADTLALSGKYIQQVSIIDASGKTFRPGQGVVLISPAIPES